MEKEKFRKKREVSKYREICKESLLKSREIFRNYASGRRIVQSTLNPFHVSHQLMYHCCITVVLFYGQSEIFKEEEFFIPALRMCGLKDTYYDKCVAEKAIHLSVHTAYDKVRV